MSSPSTDQLHTDAAGQPILTRRRQLQYLFTAKHHGGDRGASRWKLCSAEEFSVFDAADEHDLSDQSGALYGVQRDSEGSLVYLGYWHEQVAEFPQANDSQP